MRRVSRGPPSQEAGAVKRSCVDCGRAVDRASRCDSCKRVRAREKYIQRGPQWPAIRRLVKLRDRFRCLNCGRLGKEAGGEAVLEVDHIVALHDGGDRYAPSNLRTLCKECHLAIGER
ncbi:MAG: HNH endonuclease [Desulfurellales bacterium]|nr:MAG: HNH endonuclease [Desulfurellales bacterium]